MKKGIYLLLVSFMFVLLPKLVYAGDIYFNNPVKKTNNVFTFTVTVNDLNLNYLTGDLKTPNATITNVTMSNGWINKTGNSNHFYFYHDGKSSGNYTIATFEVTLTNSSQYEVENLQKGFNTCTTDIYQNYFGEDGTLVSKEVYDKTCGISKDATLKSLSISSGTLSPKFDSSLEIYSATVENNVSSITFNATPNHSKANIVSGATCALKEGLNTCKIVVKAEAGNTKTYTVTVTRKNKQNQNPMLSSDATFYNFVVHGGTLTTTFQPNVKEYTIHVDKNASSVYFTFTMNSNHTTYTSGKCSASTEVCRLTVTAEDGVSKITYTFHLVNPNATSPTTGSNNQSSSEVSVNANTSSSSSHTSNSSNTNKGDASTEEKKEETIPMETFTIEEEGTLEENNVVETNEETIEVQEEKKEEKTKIPFLKHINKNNLIQIGIVLCLFIGIGICSYFVIKSHRKKNKQIFKK